MKKVNNELLNDYIDNLLDTSKIKEVNNLINEDEESLKHLKALKSVDESLHHLEVTPAPAGFTERVMKLIISKSKSTVKSINYYFISVLGFFSIAIISVIVYAYKLTENTGTTDKVTILDTATNFIKDNLPNWKSLFSNNNVIMLGIVLTVILLLSGYFMFESHKNFKNKLHNISTRTL